MKWAFYVIVFVYMFYRAVYGLKVKENYRITIDTNNDDDGKYITAGERKVINCKGSNKNQKIEWINSDGQVVSRLPSNRVYASQYMASRAAGPSLVLTIGSAAPHDSGIWLCRSGNLVRNVSICVIDPTEFENTPDEVSVDEGRSFTLSCQVKGEPEPRITWSRNGIEINDDYTTDKNKYRVMMKYNSQGIEGLLTITSLTTEDSGVYTCNAIQESQAEMDDCSNTESFNITLNINHAPLFEKEDAREKVYGEEGETLFIKCEAEGYPLPKYHWFKKFDSGLFAFSEKDIVDSDNGTSSILKVKVTKDTYTEQYICRATNDLGEEEMTFFVLEPMAPQRPSRVEPVNSTDKTIILNITWDEEIFFDINEVDVQYLPTTRLPKKRFPKESDWRSAKKSMALISDIFDFSTMVLLNGLEEVTEYWVRLRVKNNVGVSAWSAAVMAVTEEKNEEQEEDNGGSGESETSDSDDELISTATPVANPPSIENSGKFYGFFFAGGVLLVAVACTLIAKMV